MSRTAKPWYYQQSGWWMCYLGGKKIRLAKGRKNKRAARAKLAELLAKMLTSATPESPDQTIASVIEAYLEHARSGLAAVTFANRKPLLQNFAERHGWRRIEDCKPLHLTAWLASQKGWTSDWTKATAARYIQTVFNWALRQKIVRENPFAGFSHPSGDPRREITHAEFQAMLRGSRGRVTIRRPSPGARFRQLLIFLWYTGCRPGEAAKLQWSHVDFEAGCIILRQHKTSRSQRQKRPRVVPLHPVVMKLLRHIQAREEGAYVFLTHRRTSWDKNSLGLRIRRARELTNIPADAKLYGVRHAFGTRAVINGVGLKPLSELMGHTTTRMTEHYVHLAGQHEYLAAAMRLANVRR